MRKLQLKTKHETGMNCSNDRYNIPQLRETKFKSLTSYALTKLRAMQSFTI